MALVPTLTGTGKYLMTGVVWKPKPNNVYVMKWITSMFGAAFGDVHVLTERLAACTKFVLVLL